jgi:hypothetical protein
MLKEEYICTREFCLESGIIGSAEETVLDIKLSQAVENFLAKD